MLRKRIGDVEWLQFEQLSEQPGLIHGVFLRHGGVSPPPFQTLNVGGGTGDAEVFVAENRRRICAALQMDTLISVHQIHGKEVVYIHSSTQANATLVGDSLITALPGVGLLIKHADCQAAIFYDPVHRAIANVHCGWKGNVYNIYRETLQMMHRLFATDPQEVLVGISPSLGPDHAEFKHYKEEFPEQFWQYEVFPNHFDLWAIARDQLMQAGVLACHIEIAGLCTFAEERDCFSARRDKITGRHATVVGLVDC